MNSKFTKIVAVLSAMGIMLSFAACGGSKESETTTEAPSASDTSTTAPTTEAPTVDPNASTAAPDPNASTEASTEGAKELSKDEIVAEFNKAYEASFAALNGKVTGAMSLANGKVNGKEPSSVIMGAVNKLVPSAEKTSMGPASDKQGGSFTNSGKCNLTAAEVSNATYKDNGDGTATITINPVKIVGVSNKGKDAQGKLFNVYGDLKPQIEGAGLTVEKSDVTYPASNYVTITYNTSTKMISKYQSKCVASLDIVNISGFMVIKNVNGSIDLVYEMKYGV